MSPPTISKVARPGFSERTEEGRAFLQSRIALFARVMLALMTGYLVLGVGLLFVVPEHPLRHQPYAGVAAAAALAGALGLWLSTRGRLRSAPWVALADYACVVDAGILAAVTIYFMRGIPLAPFGGFFVVAMTVFGRALIVPSTARRTAIASSLALGPVVLSIVLMGLEAPEAMIVLPVVQFTLFAAWAVIAVVLATIGSSIIYGLREQVREARQLGQYTLIEKLGEGGMGAVYLARHALLRRPTAIKLLPPDAAGAAQLERFEREVQHTAELTHPNTVAIFDYGRSPDGVFYYAMEYLDGVDLETLVADHGPQPPGRVIHILRQICGALGEAHDRGLVHRDVKPANVFLCRRGGLHDVVKVLDFGLVKDLAQPEGSLTGVNVVAGTPGYLAPETITAPETVGPAADLYALGCLAYYLSTGEPVFTGATVVEICTHHLHTRPPSPADHDERPTPRDLAAVILRCLEKRPADRFAGVQALRKALDQLDDADAWRDEDAETWWTASGRAPSREPISAAFESTMQIDLEARPAP